MATVKVLVVDDSSTTRLLMTEMINRSGDMQVVGEAEDGRQAVCMTDRCRPDVVLMDVIMPGIDGLEATRQIMYAQPTPIVLISASLTGDETDLAFRALKSGALTVLPKPAGLSDTQHITSLVSTLRAMAGVQVIHHWKHPSEPKETLASTPSIALKPAIIAIAASTGGPAALSEIIRKLPLAFSIPVVIVQHITPDFVPSLVTWFKTLTRLPVAIAQPGQLPAPGSIYVAPGNAHLRLTPLRTFELVRAQNGARYMPCADILLRSVAEIYGPEGLGIVLTGMDNDGAQGLHAMRNAGAFTIAQDESTSVVFGMPREAIERGAACQVLPLSRIAQVLANLTSQESIS